MKIIERITGIALKKRMTKNGVQELIQDAIYHRKNQNYSKAAELLSQAIQEQPKLDILYNNRGNVYRDLNRIDDAIKDYEKAIALNSRYFEAFNGLGLALKSRGEIKNAEICFLKAIEIEPTYSPARKNLEVLVKQKYK